MGASAGTGQRYDDTFEIRPTDSDPAGGNGRPADRRVTWPSASMWCPTNCAGRLPTIRTPPSS
ncbi:hypothetical protein MHPYR_30237 [uncultured Mycobacterium sp.]|uniref:Uncharacterized protein n=1 Tax=uncultured Mycobacterium sp. TaxID=171292 RepID=A0A1Y5PFK9_9MYCO|nr:hypothetical protein MHPYR_30237 [uncultured Mycobacterium sp.]